MGDIVSVGQLDAEQLLYIPGADRFGPDDASFEFRVIDDNSQPAISLANNRLSVSIDPVSDAPEGLNSTHIAVEDTACLLYTSPSPRDATLSRMPSSA